MIRYANQVNNHYMLHIKQLDRCSIRQLNGLCTKAPKVAPATIFSPCSCTIKLRRRHKLNSGPPTLI